MGLGARRHDDFIPVTFKNAASGDRVLRHNVDTVGFGRSQQILDE
jgi:hypothetical protein